MRKMQTIWNEAHINHLHYTEMLVETGISGRPMFKYAYFYTRIYIYIDYMYEWITEINRPMFHTFMLTIH